MRALLLSISTFLGDIQLGTNLCRMIIEMIMFKFLSIQSNIIFSFFHPFLKHSIHRIYFIFTVLVNMKYLFLFSNSNSTTYDDTFRHKPYSAPPSIDNIIAPTQPPWDCLDLRRFQQKTNDTHVLCRRYHSWYRFRALEHRQRWMQTRSVQG